MHLPSDSAAPSSSTASSASSAAARLCGTCGMCCDGVLFHSVELQPADSPRQLASLGMKLRRKKGVEFFLQPCSMHREENGQCSCKIYEERPERCRAFDCRQLQAVAAGSKTEAAALEMIRTAKAGVATANELISRISETNPNRSLAHRAANALTLARGAEKTPLQAELESAMQGLEELLNKEFRV